MADNAYYDDPVIVLMFRRASGTIGEKDEENVIKNILEYGNITKSQVGGHL